MGRKRAQRENAPTVYRKRYHVDESRSLAELHGWDAGKAEAGPGLVGRFNAAITKPVCALDVRELEMLLSQGSDPHFLLPAVLRMLATDIAVEFGSGLLASTLVLPEPVWASHPELRDRLVAIIRTSEAVPLNAQALARTFVEST